MANATLYAVQLHHPAVGSGVHGNPDPSQYESLGGGGNLTGTGDPNGVVTGNKGQIYTQVFPDGTALIWVNVDNNKTWV